MPNLSLSLTLNPELHLVTTLILDANTKSKPTLSLTLNSELDAVTSPILNANSISKLTFEFDACYNLNI